MVIQPKKSPYHGMWAFAISMFLPSVVITAILYGAFVLYQPQFRQEMNWAAAKIFGCGCGILFHLGCWIAGVFAEDYKAVKERLKEFCENIIVSVRLAFCCYWEDVKTLGVAFWIDVAMIALNAGVFWDALRDYLAIRGR